MRLSDGRAFDAKGSVEGPEGRRRRLTAPLTSLPLDDSVLVALGDSELGLQWTKLAVDQRRCDKNWGTRTRPLPAASASTRPDPG